MASDPNTSSSGVERIPDFEISQIQFLVASNRHPELLEKLLKSIEANAMAPYYLYLAKEIKLTGLVFDQSLYDSLAAINTSKVEELTRKIAEVDEEDEGELEIARGWTKLGEYYAQIGDRENAVTTLRKAIELAASTGSKIDLLLTIARVGFFFDDKKFVKETLDQSNALIEKGGDWERRNRYKAYLGIYLMSTRMFEEAAKLLIDSLATFTSTEVTTYESIAQYALVCGTISLERQEIRKKLIESPEILSIATTTNTLDPVFKLVKSLYFCEYNTFFANLLETNDTILVTDKYLAPHASYYMREIRVRAYAQLLESYKSLSLKSMAEHFQIPADFLDADLCKFIPNNKLNCVIDRVNGIVETNRPDNKNNQYQLLLKNGDSLLTKLQKYGAAVRLSGAERVA
ncbi:unnamed protein product [Kuraishia capsulata CBS 1993]|uniref:PCI domain-containing protein n=1 Tax=Kuraishia capsulata CBS 1993 TaxID=1382522 RepID=W6MJK7_9ASCO|nr:uncharacterized protein KUCA_T00000603001 [Kuraishia capsulata CBS 1993]CDK24637.1 unnamed protein product [Kuraishia capsulata CBS 1993]